MKIKNLPKFDKYKKKYPHAGHRARLRDKFLKSGIDALHDYEIVELLLTLGTPLKDCKQMAKAAIKEFGSLREVLDASLVKLQKIKGIGPSNAFGVKLFQAIAERYAKEKVSAKKFFDSPEVVAEYLQKRIGRKNKEHFVMLCLNSRNKLIIDDVSVGTLNASLVHPREVFKKAIQANAALVIVAHNHPSGDTEPSEDDLVITKNLAESGKILGIEITDHIIVAKDKFLSFKEHGLI